MQPRGMICLCRSGNLGRQGYGNPKLAWSEIVDTIPPMTWRYDWLGGSACWAAWGMGRLVLLAGVGRFVSVTGVAISAVAVLVFVQATLAIFVAILKLSRTLAARFRMLAVGAVRPTRAYPRRDEQCASQKMSDCLIQHGRVCILSVAVPRDHAEW